MRLENKVAFITGAAGGLGLGIATRFAAEGAAVYMVDRDRDRGEPAAQKLREQGYIAQFLQADLADPAAITATVEKTVVAAGRLDIVVNNAAVFLQKRIDEITVKDWDWLMSIDLRAPLLVVQAALPALKASQGSVLNISSTAALKVFSPNLTYIAAKAGLIAMTKCMAQELRQYRIRVNCLCPGAVDTPALHTDVSVRGHEPTAVQRMQEAGLLTTPEELAAVALNIVSSEGAVMTGSIVVADAGAMLA